MPAITNEKTRVLVVDDRRDTLKILGRLLEVSGLEPHLAASGSQALEMFPAVHPHVVLLDLGMPEIDGFEVCRRIRQAPGSEAVLIVIISGYEQEEHKVKAIEAGANYYFVKPVDPAKLLILIEQHFATE